MSALKQVAGALALGLGLAVVSGAGPLKPGDHRLRLPHQGSDRGYMLHVPPGPSRPRPLLVGLHGGGGSSWSFSRKTGFSELADREGFLALYPDGSGRLMRDRLLTWNAGHCCGHARRQDVDDVGFLEAVLDDVARRVPVDTSRVYFTGHSNGAFMALRFAAERPHRVAAVAPLAGGIGGRVSEAQPELRIPEPSLPVPVALLHGRRDVNVRFEGGRTEGVEKQRRDVGFVDSVLFWLRVNGCPSEPVEELRADGALVIWRFPGCAGAEVAALVARDGEHGWWGGQGRWPGRDPTQGLSATELIWEFLSRQHR